jgi:hypothetical protein
MKFLAILALVLQDPSEKGTQDMKAPEFGSNVTWFNVEKPLTVAGLRGKLVLLDFWTYG